MKEPTEPGQNTGRELSIEELQTRLNAVQAQREQEFTRHARLAKELEWLRHEIGLRNAEGYESIQRNSSAKDGAPLQQEWDSMPAVQRSLERGEKKLEGYSLAWLWAALFLRFARSAARRRDYATAEVFYQAVLYFRPRTFIWRQLGNMMAGQGLFHGAIKCFDRAIKLEPKGTEAWLAKSVAHKRIGEADQSRESYANATRIDSDWSGPPPDGY